MHDHRSMRLVMEFGTGMRIRICAWQHCRHMVCRSQLSCRQHMHEGRILLHATCPVQLPHSHVTMPSRMAEPPGAPGRSWWRVPRTRGAQIQGSVPGAEDLSENDAHKPGS